MTSSPAAAHPVTAVTDAQPDTPATVEQLRAFRFALDLTPAQTRDLARHAGRCPLGVQPRPRRQGRRTQDMAGPGRRARRRGGVAEAEARRQVKVPVPTKPVIQKAWNQAKGDSRLACAPDFASIRPSDDENADGGSGAHAGQVSAAVTEAGAGICPWWHKVSTYAFQSAFIDADAAWKGWLDSRAGRRAGRRVGYPRFKKKGRARDSFRLHHDVKRPTIRLHGYRQLQLPRIGLVRLHDTAKPLARLITRDGAVVQSVTISRGAHRWYASVLIKVTASPAVPTRAQLTTGAVGVDLGVHHLAALSTGELIDNPRHLAAATKRLTKAQRALSRSEKGSARRSRARRRLARRHHELAERRASTMHQLTKRLATSWADIAIEDLNVAGMTRSARGTIAAPGANVRSKAGLNRGILDASFGELRRQLTYKTSWYGSHLHVADRWAPTSKTCSRCRQRNPNLTLRERTFHCRHCGLILDRDVNAAVNITAAAITPEAWHASVAPGTGETKNARRGSTRPGAARGARQPPAKREGLGTRRVPPRRSDPPASPTRASAQVK